jgi:hypothetical protein
MIISSLLALSSPFLLTLNAQMPYEVNIAHLIKGALPMKQIQIFLTAFLFFLVSAQAHAQEQWKALPQYSFNDLYYEGGLFSDKNVRKSQIVSSDAMSWPDGRQALIILLEVHQFGNKWLYKCVHCYDRDLRQTGHLCYELMKPSTE